MNEPVSLKLRPRALTVTPSPYATNFVDTSSVSSFSRNDFLDESAQNHFLHTIDQLEPNAVFDVEVKPVYEPLGNRPISENEASWERTSCRTQMRRMFHG